MEKKKKPQIINSTVKGYMEILRRVGEKLEQLGTKMVFVSIVKDLGVTKESVSKMGIIRFQKVYDQYFENLMKKSPEELQSFLNEKYEKMSKERRIIARRFIQRGLREYLRKRYGG